MISAARAKLLPVLSSLKPLASDDVLLDLARFYADRYQAIWQKAGAAACYAFASGNGDQSDAAELPSSFVQRELEIEVRIVYVRHLNAGEYQMPRSHQSRKKLET